MAATKLLVVEHDARLRALIRATFEDAHTEVSEATSAFSARRQIAADRPDVILVAVELGLESGLDLCRELESSAATASPFSREERRVMEQHPVIGFEMLRNVAFLRGEGLSVVRSHHERWDGAGYPDGLAGTEIPLGARIFAVVDALDAMTSDRPYRRARSWYEAALEIARESGRQFDPRVVAAFGRCAARLYELARALAA
jgi:response regulator RpfG family c-di-GMP phosphodiesterase